jgi:hypothetical protein
VNDEEENNRALEGGEHVRGMRGITRKEYRKRKKRTGKTGLRKWKMEAKRFLNIRESRRRGAMRQQER